MAIICENQIASLASGDGYLTVIPVFNQFTMLKNTIEKLSRFGLKRILILDNGSSFPPLVGFYSQTDISVCVHHGNPGPRYYTESHIWNQLPETFFVTDPDLEYPSDIPDTLVEDMIGLSEKNRWGKLGLALNKDCKHLFTENVRNNIDGWEGGYWHEQIDTMPGGDPVWNALTDTTFHMNNKKYYGEFFRSPRIGGRYTLLHYGWHKDRPGTVEENDYFDKYKGLHSSTVR
jgi:hypothetical protein